MSRRRGASSRAANDWRAVPRGVWVVVARLGLLALNIIFVGMAVAIAILASKHSTRTSALSNIFSHGGISVNLFEDPDSILLVVSMGILMVALQGMLGAWLASRRVLLTYFISVVAVLTALVYLAAMLFIYREDADQMIQAYFQEIELATQDSDEVNIPPSDRHTSFTPAEQAKAATAVRFEMKRTGILLCVVGAMFILALICASFIMGCKYTLKHIGTGVNAIGLVFGLSLLVLSYVVATSSYDVPDALNAKMEVEFTHSVGEYSLEAVNFVELLRLNPEIMFQDHRNRVFFPPSPAFPPKHYSPPPPPMTHTPTSFLHHQKMIRDHLVPTKAPTTSPTTAPTTLSPTTKSSTLSPTSAASPTTASPTTAPPTPASPTSLSPTTTTPTASPTSLSPTTTTPTASPTTSSPTPSPTSATRKLLDSVSGSPPESLTTGSPTSSPTTWSPTSSPTLLSSTINIGWKFPARAVWVQDIVRDDIDERTEEVSFQISFTGVNTSLLFEILKVNGEELMKEIADPEGFHSQGHPLGGLKTMLRFHVAAGAHVMVRSVTCSELTVGAKHAIAGAWAAHLLAVSGGISAIISGAGVYGTMSGNRDALKVHFGFTLAVMLLLVIATSLIFSNADETEKLMRYHWHQIQTDVVGSRLSVVEATQLVDNNMRMVGAWGATCLTLLTLSCVTSIAALFVFPAVIPAHRRRNRRRTGDKSSDSDDDSQSGGATSGGNSQMSSLLPSRRHRDVEATPEDSVVLEMQELQRLLERTTAAVGQSAQQSSAQSGSGDNPQPHKDTRRDKRSKKRDKYKRHYGSSESDVSSSEGEDPVAKMIQQQFERSDGRAGPNIKDPNVLSSIVGELVAGARRHKAGKKKKQGKAYDDLPAPAAPDVHKALSKEGVRDALEQYFGQKSVQPADSNSAGTSTGNTAAQELSSRNEAQTADQGASKYTNPFTIDDMSGDE